MNTIIMKGGLGNQLFQYAFGRAQIFNGIDVVYNLSWYKKLNDPPRPYWLDKFCIVPIKVDHIPYRRLKKRNYIHERGFNQNLLKKDNCIFNGYWQYYLYYENILPILKKEFQVKKEFYTKEFLNLKEKIVDSDSVSIHVRRGDYINKKGKEFGCLPFRYYYQAITKIVKGDLFVFSDDISWCKKHFKQDYFLGEITFVHLEGYLDFELIRLCKYNIIANSSFSWLAAYLNDNPKKIVICPIHWLNEKFVDKDRYPKDWIKIRY